MSPLLSYILVLLASLNVPPGDRRRIADGIVAHAADAFEARVLISLRRHEDGLNVNARTPYGLVCCRRALANGASPDALARGIFLRGMRRCHDTAGGFRFYLRGDCRLTRRAGEYAGQAIETMELLSRTP